MTWWYLSILMFWRLVQGRRGGAGSDPHPVTIGRHALTEASLAWQLQVKMTWVLTTEAELSWQVIYEKLHSIKRNGASQLHTEWGGRCCISWCPHLLEQVQWRRLARGTQGFSKINQSFWRASFEPATYKFLIVCFDHSEYFQIRLCECQVCHDQVLLTIPLSGESSIPWPFPLYSLHPRESLHPLSITHY